MSVCGFLPRSSKYFDGSSMILFLNKRDLFEEKLRRVPISVCPEFFDYKGPQTLEDSSKFITRQFEERRDKDHRMRSFSSPRLFFSAFFSSLFFVFAMWLGGGPLRWLSLVVVTLAENKKIYTHITTGLLPFHFWFAFC